MTPRKKPSPWPMTRCTAWRPMSMPVIWTWRAEWPAGCRPAWSTSMRRPGTSGHPSGATSSRATVGSGAAGGWPRASRPRPRSAGTDEDVSLPAQVLGEVITEEVQEQPDLGGQVAMAGVDRPGHPLVAAPLPLHQPQPTRGEILVNKEQRQLGQAQPAAGCLQQGGAVVAVPASLHLDPDAVGGRVELPAAGSPRQAGRSEEHTSEL